MASGLEGARKRSICEQLLVRGKMCVWGGGGEGMGG